MTDEVVAWLETANQLHEIGRQEEALRYCLSILDKDPQHIEALRLQAEIFVSLGQLSDAAQVYQRIAVSFAANGDFLQALSTAKELHVINPDDCEALTRKLAQEYSQIDHDVDPQEPLNTFEFPSEFSVDPTNPSASRPETQQSEEDTDDEEEMIRRLLQLQGYDADAELSDSELDDTLGGAEEPENPPSLPPLFQQLDARSTAAIWAEMDTVRVSASEKIIRQGEAGGSFYIIVEGTVVITHEIDDMEEELGHLGPGQFFGEIALLTPLKRTANVTAISDCKLLRLERSALEGIIAGFPHVHQELKRFVYQRLIHNLLVSSLIFFPLSDIKRWELAQQFNVVEIPPDYMILQEGQQADGLYLIAGGHISILQSQDGEEPRLISDLGPGQFFGELSLISREPMPGAVVTREASTFLKLHAAEFYRVMEQYPRVYDLLRAVAVKRSKEFALYQMPAEPVPSGTS